MSVTLRKRKNRDGSTTLRLDIYSSGIRRVETLNHLKLVNPTNAAEIAENRNKLELAKQIAIARAHELQAMDYGIITDTGKNTLVVEWLQHFVDRYKKKDKRNMQGAANRFKDFLKEDGIHGLVFGRLTETMVEDFQDYLGRTSVGEGPASYFSRFKRMIKHAFRQNLLKKNPAADVKIKSGKARYKDVLSMEEIQILLDTPIQNEEIRKAFLFSCLTGLRWIDVKNLSWGDVHLKEQVLRIRQAKTGLDVSIPLNETALSLLGDPLKAGKLVFDLPTANGCNKTLKAWVKRAEIDKAITWHNARHSFGTNLIASDVGELTTSKLMGHTSMKYIPRYVKIAEGMKKAAVDKLNLKF